MDYIESSTDEALKAKWARGAERYGSKFVGHPLKELDEELLDAINYVAEAERQGWLMQDMAETLRSMREWVRRVYLRTPEAPEGNRNAGIR